MNKKRRRTITEQDHNRNKTGATHVQNKNKTITKQSHKGIKIGSEEEEHGIITRTE